MKTIKTSIFAILCVGILASCSTETKVSDEVEKNKVVATETSTVNNYTVDNDNSKVNWKGTMIGVYSHDGTINFKSGDVTVTDGVVTGGNFVIDMNTITPLDENYGPSGTKEDLVKHLGSDEFFGVAENPTASLKITAGTEMNLNADLTIKGVTEQVVVTDVKVTEENDVLTASGKVTFDRQKFGASYAPAKDVVLSDDIELEITISAKKK